MPKYELLRLALACRSFALSEVDYFRLNHFSDFFVDYHVVYKSPVLPWNLPTL